MLVDLAKLMVLRYFCSVISRSLTLQEAQLSEITSLLEDSLLLIPGREREREFISQINGGLPDKAFAHRAGHP